MATYGVCGLSIESNIALAELAGAELDNGARSADPDCRIWCLPDEQPASCPSKWLSDYRGPDGGLWLSVARHEEGYLLRFPELADLVLSRDARTVRCYPSAGIPLETIGHLLADRIIPLVLTQRGHQVIHASSVLTSRGAIGFFGPSGAGKSTLAASFGQGDCPVLGDDYLRVQQDGSRLIAIPSHPSLRLCPDAVAAFRLHRENLSPVAHYCDKRRVQAWDGEIAFSRNHAVLRRLYAIAPPGEPGSRSGGDLCIEPLSRREAFMALATHSYRLISTDRDIAQREFERLAGLASLVEVFCLAVPRDHARLPEVRAAILDHLSSN